MAIDQNSVPKDPVHLNPNRCLFTASSSSPYPPSSCSTAGDSPAADESADDQPSARKVKLLCSFGGKILPRPSDGALRYAGGQTRIIAVRRDTTFPELCRKMKDAYGAPVAIRYQLPDEDLDALVSVSSAEDLDNMMDEYDKLAEVSGDGSAKLRVFLFSQAEIASVLADNLSVGPARSDPYEGGQKYVEAVNGGSASDAGIYACEIRRKGSMASASSTQNSDGGFDGSNNDGASSAIASPAAGASAAFDPSTLTFAGTATSGTLPESQGFPASSTFFGQAMVTTQSLNPPHAPPYTSQAFVEPHQVHYMPPLSLNMAAAPRMVNVVSVPQHTYPSFLPTTPSSMPAQVGTVKTVKGKVDPFSEEDQLSGRFVQPMSDHSYNVFQQPLSQIPPLQPSHLPPPSIEPYGLHLVPPLSKVPLLIFEDCQMCQKSLPHVHSDRLVNEPGDRPIVHSYHSQDIARMQGQHRSVTAAMMENSVEPKFEHSVNPCQYGNYGANKVPDLALDREQLFGATAEKIDHSKLRHPLGAVGLSGDAQESYGVFVSSAQSHLEGSFQQQKKQVLHGENFHAAKVLRPTDTLTLSSGINASNVASLSPPQTQRCDALQQQNVLLAEGADPIQVFHPSGAIGLSSTVQPSYGVFQSPPQPHHDESLQQQQLPAETATAFFPAKQALISKQGGKDSFSMNNVRYNVLEPPSLAQDYVEQVDGVMEALNLSTFDTLRSSDLLKPTLVPNVGAQDMKLENLYAVRDNHAFRLPNDANALLSSNGFITSAVGPDGMYIKPANPVVLNTSISREIRPESPSVIVEDNNTVKSHHGASKLPSSNAFISTGRLPMETSMGRINPLLSNMMELHTSELANASQASTIFGSSMLRAQNFERGAKPLTDSQRIPGMSPYIIDPAYSNTVAEGTSKAWEDEVSQAQAQNLFDGMAASQRGNAPFPLSSLLVPGEVGQFRETFLPGSLLGNEDPQEILESMNACRPRTAIVATRGPTISGDNSCENRLPMGQSPDIAVLLEEGALQPPADWLIRESRPDPVVGTKDPRADYINQDLRDLAEQVGESVLQSSPPGSVPPFSGPEEICLPFLCSHTSNENRSPKGQSPDIAVLLEEGSLQPPVDWLIKESRLDPIVGTKDTGADYIDQDLHDLAEQVVESVLESSTPPLSVQSFNGSKEMNPPFLRESGLSEDNSNSQSASVPGDQRIENIKARQSDKLHMGFLMANDIGRLQIIKNSDLEELRELGSGTFGTVYHGKWRGSDVAIKRINDRCFAGKPSEQEKMRADFWNEASKLADLHHPNVVAFYGVVIDGPGGSFATVTEYMVNGSLRNVLQRDDTTLDRRKCLLIAMDVAFGMEYLHGKNIVHFDLKSDNLLVNLRDPQRPICKVGDLGLSKVKCKTLISGGVRGTLPWMAPELLNGSSNLVSEKVDVFSFGIVMWELLTGEEPYSDLHYGAIIGGIVSNTLRPTVPDSCDPEWGALMERCWSAEPTDRPSFTEIANRLRSMEALLPQKGQAQK
ncbi:uncharacterized protein LOC110096990 isoform X1 [Dendrobium catenatum]|uniref:uncharacterized protein LOC110096990 isoform X1 n=1 Tax=Dendrobium catenatum TaxID=906689 RepID=UPI0009F481FB|nr:uncharacterized protein LOC110096990 isoform X1 [Dendrobium catenatum]